MTKNLTGHMGQTTTEVLKSQLPLVTFQQGSLPGNLLPRIQEQNQVHIGRAQR